MNKNAKKWVKALRSGKYQQGTGALCNVQEGEPDLFCCLGVACDLYQKENGDLKVEQTTWKPGQRTYDGRTGSLPEKVEEWLGLADGDGSYKDGDTSLASYNDAGKTFKQIAAIIEREPKGLFATGS